jgi:hypothetical protein
VGRVHLSAAKAQHEGDKDGMARLKFYLDNQDEMQRGAVVTNPYRFNQRMNEDGEPVEIDALQSYYNRVADWGLSRVLAELQNDPEAEESEETIGLTAGMVAARLSGLRRNELPKADVQITAAIDVGKYYSHWVKIAWHGNCVGHVIDYGVVENPSMTTGSPTVAVETAICKSLMAFRSDLLAQNPPELCLVDSGDYTEAIYQFCRQAGGCYKPSKGFADNKFRPGKESDSNRHFLHAYAKFQRPNGVWLYGVNVEFWKQWVHERFVTPTLKRGRHIQPGQPVPLLRAEQQKRASFVFAPHCGGRTARPVCGRQGNPTQMGGEVKKTTTGWMQQRWRARQPGQWASG